VQEDKQSKNETYSSNNIDDWDFLLGVVLVFLLCLLRDQGPQLVQIDGRVMVLVLPDVEVSHTKL